MTHTTATLETTRQLWKLAADERKRISAETRHDFERMESLIDYKIGIALSNQTFTQTVDRNNQALAKAKQTGRRLNIVLIFAVGVLAGVLLMAIAGPPVS